MSVAPDATAASPDGQADAGGRLLSVRDLHVTYGTRASAIAS